MSNKHCLGSWSLEDILELESKAKKALMNHSRKGFHLQSFGSQEKIC